MNMTKEEYDAMPIEDKPMYVAMVDRGDGYVLHHACQNGYFASERGLMMALGDEDIAIFKLEYQCKTFKPFGMSK